MRFYSAASLLIIALLGTITSLPGDIARAETCESVVRELNQILGPRVDEKELVSILEALNETGNRTLPPKFVTKAQARKMGWKPGRDLWDYKNLKGKSIGGDLFGNREGRLPDGKRVWREADLDYQGGHRGPKRILYSNDGRRFVTVDHYRNFKEVPPCR
jgi:ribonuclease T1